MSAKVPTENEVTEKFGELVESGLDFLTRAAQELTSRQKYSILHFSTGLELLLKARLFAEHWALVGSSPHSCTWSGLVAGEAHTLGARDLCPTLSRLTGTALTTEREVFEAVFDHRNSVVHWVPPATIAATAAEQCKASYYLFRLLTARWQDVYAKFLPNIQEAEQRLFKYREYLQTRFDSLENKLKGPANGGRLITCPACEFDAGVLEEADTWFTEFECWVCTTADYVIQFPCGNWLPIQEFQAECACGDEHELADFLQQGDLDATIREEVLALATPEPMLSPKELHSYEPPEAFCGECFPYEPTVKPTGDPASDDYVCIECAARFEIAALDNCEWCNASWAGVSLEHSGTTGCDNCDGLVGHQMAKDD